MENSKQILLLVNSKSGRGRALKVAIELKEELALRSLNHGIFYDENWPLSLDNFSEVWLIGGDGTVNYFINRYRFTTVPLIIFKGGTGNDISWKLYGDMSVKQQVELVRHAPVKTIDADMCNGRLYVNSLGIVLY